MGTARDWTHTSSVWVVFPRRRPASPVVARRPHFSESHASQSRSSVGFSPGSLTTLASVSELLCSAKGCRNSAAFALHWNNPKLHDPDRRKTWLACPDHL